MSDEEDMSSAAGSGSMSGCSSPGAASEAEDNNLALSGDTSGQCDPMRSLMELHVLQAVDGVFVGQRLCISFADANRWIVSRPSGRLER